jgi:hypothetical protein
MKKWSNSRGRVVFALRNNRGEFCGIPQGKKFPVLTGIDSLIF